MNTVRKQAQEKPARSLETHGLADIQPTHKDM